MLSRLVLAHPFEPFAYMRQAKTCSLFEWQGLAEEISYYKIRLSGKTKT